MDDDQQDKEQYRNQLPDKCGHILTPPNSVQNSNDQPTTSRNPLENSDPLGSNAGTVPKHFVPNFEKRLNTKHALDFVHETHVHEHFGNFIQEIPRSEQAGVNIEDKPKIEHCSVNFGSEARSFQRHAGIFGNERTQHSAHVEDFLCEKQWLGKSVDNPLHEKQCTENYVGNSKLDGKSSDFRSGPWYPAQYSEEYAVQSVVDSQQKTVNDGGIEDGFQHQIACTGQSELQPQFPRGYICESVHYTRNAEDLEALHQKNKKDSSQHMSFSSSEIAEPLLPTVQNPARFTGDDRGTNRVFVNYVEKLVCPLPSNDFSNQLLVDLSHPLDHFGGFPTAKYQDPCTVPSGPPVSPSDYGPLIAIPKHHPNSREHLEDFGKHPQNIPGNLDKPVQQLESLEDMDIGLWPQGYFQQLEVLGSPTKNGHYSEGGFQNQAINPGLQTEDTSNNPEDETSRCKSLEKFKPLQLMQPGSSIKVHGSKHHRSAPSTPKRLSPVRHRRSDSEGKWRKKMEETSRELAADITFMEDWSHHTENASHLMREWQQQMIKFEVQMERALRKRPDYGVYVKEFGKTVDKHYARQRLKDLLNSVAAFGRPAALQRQERCDEYHYTIPSHYPQMWHGYSRFENNWPVPNLKFYACDYDDADLHKRRRHSF